MPEFLPDVLAAWTEGRWTRLPAGAITGFTIDSREAKPGDCFVALRTDRRDGHDFVASAAAQGAVAAIVQREVEGCGLPQLVVADPLSALQACAQAHRQAFSGIVVGLTGSAGKTSTKELLTRMLGAERTLATLKNLNNHLGVPLTLLQLDDRRHRFAVIEVGINRAGEMEPLASIVRPNIGLVTNVGPAHLEGLRSVEQVAIEKARLLRAMSGDGFAVYPESCDAYAAFRDLPGQKRVVGEASALGGTANVTFQTKHKLRSVAGQATAPQSGASGPDAPGEAQLELHLPGRPGFFFCLQAMPGGMRMNAMLAATVALSLGSSEAAVQAGLTAWRPAEFRGEIREREGSVYYLDCYNANPLSMSDALRYFSERFPDQPRLWVIGSMRELGQASEEAHHAIGRSLSLGPHDRAIFIGESADILLAGALASGNPADRLTTCASTGEARAGVAGFRGAVFLKGSRAFKLETLYPAEEGSPC